MSKEELDATKGVMHSILQGVSCKSCYFDTTWPLMVPILLFLYVLQFLAGRLENPDHLFRRMASSVALIFSKVVDPKNPLYLDDSCSRDTIDWEFGLVIPDNRIQAVPSSTDKGKKVTATSIASVAGKELESAVDDGAGNNLKERKKKLSEFRVVDPDEIIDPAMLNDESTFGGCDDDENSSGNSESSNDSYLQPYDLSDDDIDLKKKFTQLVDVVGALRKSDDADGVSHYSNYLCLLRLSLK